MITWKRRRLLNDLKYLELDVIAVNETRISNTRTLALIFNNYLLIGQEWEVV